MRVEDRPEVDALGGVLLRSFLALALVVSARPAAAQAHEAAPLGPVDFVVAEIGENSDSADVRDRLGRPDSTRVYPNPFDRGGELAAWFYPDLIVSYGYEGMVLGLTIIGPSRATARGLRPGDPAEKVRRLYGAPTIDGIAWSYPDPNDIEGMHAFIVQVKNGRVTSVFMGYLLD